MFITHYKIFGFPKPNLLHNLLHMQVSPDYLFCCPMGIGTQKSRVNVNTLVLLMLWTIKFFASEPGVLCLLPASTTLGR